MKYTEFVRRYEVNIYWCGKCHKEYNGNPEDCPKCGYK